MIGYKSSKSSSKFPSDIKKKDNRAIGQLIILQFPWKFSTHAHGCNSFTSIMRKKQIEEKSEKTLGNIFQDVSTSPKFTQQVILRSKIIFYIASHDNFKTYEKNSRFSRISKMKLGRAVQTNKKSAFESKEIRSLVKLAFGRLLVFPALKKRLLTNISAVAYWFLVQISAV